MYRGTFRPFSMWAKLDLSMPSRSASSACVMLSDFRMNLTFWQDGSIGV